MNVLLDFLNPVGLFPTALLMATCCGHFDRICQNILSSRCTYLFDELGHSFFHILQVSMGYTLFSLRKRKNSNRFIASCFQFLYHNQPNFLLMR